MKKVTLAVITVLTVLNLISSAWAMGETPCAKKSCDDSKQIVSKTEIPVVDVYVANRLWQGNKAVFVDALSADTYRKSHIPNAVNISANAPQVENLKSLKKDDIIVVYCSNTKCGAAKRTAEYLIERGFSQVYYFKGGKQAWVEAGYPLSS
ncbi:MAG: rhodanese-like domain-containing protein [Candidatus Auribacterota bacterium]|jgi:rhodanese-related sulfurtransferase|nr:rhodanese-like domain-containing protein [Candidatus Auribacterota bacterium]